MRIISKFKDFYDGVASFGGFDDSIVFIREKKTVKTIDFLRSNNLYERNKHGTIAPEKLNIPIIYSTSVNFNRNGIRFQYNVNLTVLLFCERTIPFFHVTLTGNYAIIQNTEWFFWTYEELQKNLEYLKITLPTTWSSRLGGYNDLKSMFEFEKNRTYSWMIEKHHVLMLFTRNEVGETIVIENSCLKDIQFYNVLDAFQTFQTIEHYISGVLAVNKVPPVELPDVDRIKKHGMDKWSFRKVGKNSDYHLTK